MKNLYIGKPLTLLNCLALLFVLTGCTCAGVTLSLAPDCISGPPPHAPAHGYRAKYTYCYYPDVQIYFDTLRKSYFYLEGTEWKVSVSLPSDQRIQLGDYVTIEMDSDKPYTKFKEHQKKYPPGQLKKNKKWAEKN